jgi:hypothetical protein
MTNSQRLAVVRTALRKWLADRNPDQDDSAMPLSEAMLIRDGHFCGRRFRFPLYHAIWFLEEDEVKILTTEGAVVGRFTGDEIDKLAQASHPTSTDTHTLSIAAHFENTLAATGQQPLAQQSADSGQASQRRAA